MIAILHSSFDWVWNCWHGIMETMTAFGTIGAVIVALWLARRDSNEQIRLEQRTDYAPGDENHPDKMQYDLYVVNEGRTVVTVTRFVGKIVFFHPKPFQLFAYKRKGTGNNQDNPDESGIIRLKSGEFLSLQQIHSNVSFSKTLAYKLVKIYWLPMFLLNYICKIGVETTKSKCPYFVRIKKEVLVASIFMAKNIAASKT